MKTWLWAVLAVVCGYLVYRGWFAPEDETETPEPPPALEVPVEEPATEPASIEPAPAAAERPRIDLEGPPPAAEAPPVRNEEAWNLETERRAAKGDRRKELGDQLLRDHPDSDPARWVAYERGREHLHRYQQLGKNKQGYAAAVQAWKELTPVLFLREAQATERDALRKTLDRLARDLLFNRRHIEGIDRMYVPKRGDNLSVLCRKVFPRWGAKVSPGFVVEVNGLGAAKNLRAGEAIKVPLGEPELVIVKHEYRLYFLLNGCFVRSFRVGLGKEGSTPEAHFVIKEKIRNPDWNPRVGVVIPFGDPRNILGTRWMAFNDSAEYDGFGIHGTSEPSSIGKEASSGCVRMLRVDVERLFEWTPRGAKVEVRR